MNIARHHHSLVSLHGRLYAIGGDYVDSVEVYDPDNNTWTLLQHKLDGEVALELVLSRNTTLHNISYQYWMIYLILYIVKK